MLVAYSAPSHYLNQCLHTVDWTPKNKFQWNLIEKITNFHARKCEFENAVCIMAAVMARVQYVCNPCVLVEMYQMSQLYDFDLCEISNKRFIISVLTSKRFSHHFEMIFPSQRASDADLWCVLRCQPVEATDELHVRIAYQCPRAPWLPQGATVCRGELHRIFWNQQQFVISHNT